MNNYRDIIKAPIITEKSADLAQNKKSPETVCVSGDFLNFFDLDEVCVSRLTVGDAAGDDDALALL